MPKDAVGRTITAADEAAAGTVVLFGRRIEIGPTPDWNKIIEGAGSGQPTRGGRSTSGARAAGAT